MEKIVFKNLNGTCGIITPVGDVRGCVWDVPEGLEYRITNVSNIPSDRTFRDAWTDENETETVDIDMLKARNIHMDKIRVVRDEKLRELDIETLKGKDVQAQKQKLRDLTSSIDLSVATTPEKLKSIWPTEWK